MATPGFDIYFNLDTRSEVEAKEILESDIRLLNDFFDTGPFFKAGDWLISWGPTKVPSIVTPEIFAVKYRKVELGEEESVSQSDSNEVHLITEGEIRYISVDLQLSPFQQAMAEEEKKPENRRLHFDSVDDARSFALEMQYALDHPEEQDEGRQFTKEEIKGAKFYIRKAKEYLAERDESL